MRLIKEGNNYAGNTYDSVKHCEFQLKNTAEVAILPGIDSVAVGSIAYLQDLSHMWNLGEDNVWHEI